MRAIRRGHEVIVIAGKEIGRKGKVIFVDRKKGRVKVEKINMIKRHVKPSQKYPQGGIVEKEGAIDMSNVQLWDPKVREACRVRRVFGEGGEKILISKKSGESVGQLT